jgi:hypothetical protein
MDRMRPGLVVVDRSQVAKPPFRKERIIVSGEQHHVQCERPVVCQWPRQGGWTIVRNQTVVFHVCRHYVVQCFLHVVPVLLILENSDVSAPGKYVSTTIREVSA